MNVRHLLIAVLAAGLLSACERPPVQSVQTGFRGTGMDQIYNPRTLAAQNATALPEALPTVPADGPKAAQVYQNVKVLGHLSVGEFARVMTAMTTWVSPQQGCTYCHNAQNFADDSMYTKQVARRMIEMTQHVNQDWKSHVADTGVTCYTCHRGNPVPKEVWFEAGKDKQSTRLSGNKAGQNTPSASAAWSALPVDPFTPYLGQAKDVKVIGTTALPNGNRASTKQTEFNYSMMMHMSGALGVNCTFCHNTRSFASWETSTPQRATAWYGIRMAQDLNASYLTPLTSNFPVSRLGPNGDVAKVNCATCHQGAYKPLNGASMLKAHPELATKVAAAPIAVASGVAAVAVPASAAMPAVAAASAKK